MTRILRTFLCIFFFLLTIIPARATNEIIIKNVVIDEAGRLIMVETQEDQRLPKPEVAKLVGPNRLIIDVPGAVLASRPKVINVNNNSIKQVRISQFEAADKKIVRIVVETDDSKIIDRIKISASQGSSIIQLENLPSSLANSMLEDNSQVKITKIDYRDNQLIIGAMGQIKIKDPYVLKGPTRLVIDILNAHIADKKLLSPILVGDKQVDVVRIGQLDDSTVRIVIETDNPNRLYPVYGSDQQTLFITSDPSFSVANLPKGVSLGFIKSIKVIEDKGLGTLVKIEASSPLVHRIRRIHDPEKVVIDLINAEAPSEDLIANIETTSELSGIKAGQLMAGNPNSRIVIDLTNPGIDVRSNISVDGKTMEIVLKQSAKLINLSGEEGGLKVVLDPGHGGYDAGCQAEGYQEKDITLDVTKRVKLLLERAGVQVFMTRTTDTTLSLKERTDFTNSINPTAFVSIHVNSSTSSAPVGIDTHWYKNQSIPLAKVIQEKLLNKVGTVDRGIQKNMFYVIHHTSVPAVLVEIGFLSNPRERREILTHQRKQNTAQGITEGVLQFLGAKYSVSN